MGFEAEKISDDLVEVTVEIQPWQTNSFAVSHGGVMMTLLDFTMAMAAKVKMNHDGAAMTIDMSTSFMKAAKGKVKAHGKVLKSGKAIQFCEATAYDESGDILAKSMGTFRLIEAKPL
jgi:uncharacterized protein (TIGR00369 family)